MARSHVSAPVRVNSGVARKQGGAGRRQQQPKHSGRGRARPGLQRHQNRQKSGRKLTSGQDNRVYSSAWRPTGPASREWGTASPSLSSQQLVLSSEDGSEQRLTQLMKDTRSLDDLLNVIIRKGESFNHVHAAAALGYLYSQLQRSSSITSKPTYCVKMVNDIASSQLSSPLLGGELMCMYIGDVLQPPLPQHGPVTWDSHATPPETPPSLRELYTYDNTSQQVTEFVGFPPRGSFPGVLSASQSFTFISPVLKNP
jgi:hypothetical protein